MARIITAILAFLFVFGIIAGSLLGAYVAYAPEALRKEVPAQSVTLVFVGDMLFDRYIRQVSTRTGDDYPFSCMREFLLDADAVVGNLEGPVTEHASVSLGSEIGSPDNFRFTFPTTTAPALARNNVGIVNLGNNHIGNFGLDGMRSTRQHLDAAGVAHIGGLAGDEPVYRLGALSFVSYNQFGGQTAEKVAELVRLEAQPGRVVIVYAHWGEEYEGPTPAMRSAAGLFVASGADLVIGSHPHVVLENELIGDVPVYYSLGNFIFDQYWNEEVRTGQVLRVSIMGDRVVSIEERSVELQRDGRTCLTP